MLTPLRSTDFSSLRLKLASPEEILSWSYGEITRPETINYRTQKPEKAGLFAEEIFGPSKDWECYCGKYKKIRYKGIICDKCGVEVTRSIVRRERMGHIALSAPVSHIWFLRGVPSKIGLFLDLSVQNLEKVIYFANFIVTDVDEEAKATTLTQVRDEYKGKRKQIEQEFSRRIDRARTEGAQGGTKKSEDEARRAIAALEKERNTQLEELEEAFTIAETELKNLKPLQILSEFSYQDLSLKYGHVFHARIGAEAIQYLLKRLDLDKEIAQLEKDFSDSEGVRREKMMRRVKLMKSLKKTAILPSWMILTMVPVIPPDLRPMVALDGGRYATSDLNDLYRRVINRNNRLKQLVSLRAPEVIVRNEKRMLQEAVDALLDNSARQGKTTMASTGQKRMLKSLSDMLKGKQGRFRQNLLGKRVDYSGRSVIVVGAHLKLHQCGLPKQMALELFKPFVMSQLIQQGYVYNVRSASRFIESGREEIWDILESITKDVHVLLNRAPTLHRLGIQSFQPVLIEGKAIQLHPLVCAAFNADFDGDQMAVHVPLTEEAKREARELMLSARNLLKPATGDPITTPTQDIVWGAYYLTYMGAVDAEKTLRLFADPKEALLSYRLRMTPLQEPIRVRMQGWHQDMTDADAKGFVVTTVGRLIFNEVIPAKVPFQNQTMKKKHLSDVVYMVLAAYGQELTAAFLDHVKDLAFKYLTRSGLSWGIGDIPPLEAKKKILEEAERTVQAVHAQYEEGLLTESERHAKVITIWTEVKDRIVELSRNVLDVGGSVFSMIDSGARGSWGQLTQIVGMKGLVTNPAGEIIELPVKGSFKEGFDVLEYFISTHGARKGLSDTALRTANAGYLTRRLVDVAQELVVREEDCGDTEGMTLTREESVAMGETVAARLFGRIVLESIKDPKTKKVIVKKGALVTRQYLAALEQIDLASVRARSVSTCRSLSGICQQCYGMDLGANDLVRFGSAIGVVAAQSIGEPGTQLTMRTFHTGGVVGQDITQGLPRVEEIFEVRPPKRRAFLADVAGKVSISDVVVNPEKQEKGEENGRSARRQKLIQILYQAQEDIVYPFSERGSKKVKAETQEKKSRKKKTKTDMIVHVKDGARVRKGATLFTNTDGVDTKAEYSGVVKLTEKSVVVSSDVERIKEYVIPFGYSILVHDGDLIDAGTALTEGSLDLQQLYRLSGRAAVQRYILREIQHIYTSQGQKLNDKHVEVIIRQMFSRVYVRSSGDTDLLPGEVVEREEFLRENLRMEETKGEKAESDELLLGISRVSLSTQSFLASASFQETARVLINAAVTGRIDRLQGLKENVIIGRLIPAGTGFVPDEEQDSKEAS